jgi:hypothetical protein
LTTCLAAITNIGWLTELVAVLWNIVLAKSGALNGITKTTYSVTLVFSAKLLIAAISPQGAIVV